MTSFAYDTLSPYPIPATVQQAHADAWQRLASPGSWWTGAERLSIVAATRDAASCPLCRSRKEALSPYGISGTHRSSAALPVTALEATHRVATDAARLTEGWLHELLDEQFTAGHYVELLGVVVAAISIDSFHQILGLPLTDLPAPRPGKPDHYWPPGAAIDVGWVPMIQPAALTEREADIYFGAPAMANVIRALSLVPDGVRLLHDLAAVHYVPSPQVGDLTATGRSSLTREQIELVAGRTSAINDCFY